LGENKFFFPVSLPAQREPWAFRRIEQKRLLGFVISGFGGLEVAYWPLEPQVRGVQTRPKPSDFSGQKKNNPQHAIPSEGK
jgi:hypothetical protein